ncbi:alpha/beta hydrolase [Geodermatophilus aquaeductus]|uniref:Lysophospholipase, alpha-beta hydrolase superfamily n=1 Tax=Geodermatophilus aquaeductus TaxID=1564161 RepID=A0A521FV88_9ACTN|nr:alpha/beta hydrolase [Geodermatophilus aquaeductus]SMP00077.1 Lysophospholipase, alpha-beta hydrolase superfamily [Geodermatophilus aquaeductus]
MSAPAWFEAALADAPEHREVDVEGTPVHYRVWGEAARPGLVLVHGGAAHSGWWDHVAPQLHSHRVVALDLSGHGDSGRRPAYDMDTWAREVVAVAAAEDLAAPVVIGHSMGGWVALTVGVAHPGAVSAVAVIDSPLVSRPPEEERLRQRRRPTRTYASVEEALERFRTLPPQDVLLPYVRDHVARGSLRREGEGWTWKFDPQLWGPPALLAELLPRLTCPAALFRCEKGLVTPAMAEEMAGLVAGRLPVVELPDAGHHPVFDRPLELVTGIRTLLAFWPGDGGEG